MTHQSVPIAERLSTVARRKEDLTRDVSSGKITGVIIGEVERSQR